MTSTGLRTMEGEPSSYPDPNSASAFTAVNAQRSPTAMNGAKPANGHDNRGPIEGEPHERPSSQAARRPVSPMQERPPNGRTSSTQQAHQSPPSPIKRKRSYPEPEEDHRTGPYHTQPYPILHQQDHNRPSSRTDGPPPNGRGGNPEKHLAHEEPHAYPPPSRLPEYDPEPSHLNGHYDPPMQSNQPYYTQGPDNADVRMAEALQRETHSSHPPPRHLEYGSHESEDQHPDEKGYHGHHDLYEHHDQYSGHPNDNNRTPVSGPDGDRKRRKRVFSNRTKTGCMTCRKRKKKCDETHPECNNCVRGGFVCEGYTIRNTWQKPVPTKMPATLMSKDGYGEPSRPPHRYSNEVSPEYADSPSQGRHPMGADGDRSKPIVVDEGREHMHGITSPSSSSRGPPQSWAKSTRTPYNGSSGPPKYYQGYERPGSAHGSHPDYPPHDMGEASMRPPTTHRTHNGPPIASPVGGPHPAPAAVAQAALQQASPPTRPTPPPTSSRSSHHRLSLSQMTEREKMLRGEYYLPYTSALMADRDRCAAAVWHFNNSMNPTTGISSEERLRFFKAILSLRPSAEPTPEGTQRPPTDNFDPPVGSVGPGVIVEAPFHCDYGYNIKIGQDVIIGPDCRISDTCSVTIGSNVVFSPGVKLICANYAVDPRDRRRGKGRQMGRAIIIEDDCWIGAGAMIMPGVRVGRSSTVAAGAVISKEVPPYTVTAGNPQKVVRGIYDDHSRD